MRSFRIRQAALLIGTAILPAMGAAPAMAQSEQPQASEEGEIVVTALRREQRLQDVPAAIAVVSGDDIKAKGAQDLRDYLTTVPGVNYAENNVGGMRIAIRGISDGIGGTDPLAGIYIDEAPVTETSAGSLDPDIYDVERVEVLKGPQGTLYGSGSMGGTVRIIGRKPLLNRVEAALESTFGTISAGGTTRRLDGVVNIPIVEDRIAFRASAGFRHDEGWINDLPRNRKDANTVEKRNARAQLLLQPTDQTSIIVGVLYQKDDIGLPQFDDLTRTFQGRTVEEYESAKIFRQSRNSEATLASLTVNQEWDGMTLTSASNYLSKDLQATFDLTPGQSRLIRILTGVTLTPSEGVGLTAPVKTKQFTQEVRLASSGNQRLGWLIGGFYSDVSNDVVEAFDLSQAPSLNGVITADEYYKSTQNRDTRQIAGFGELSYEITDALSITAGLRVFGVRQKSVIRGQGLLNGGDTFATIANSFSSSTKKFLVEYKASRDHLIYAQAVQGYRNGGPNSAVPLSSCGAALTEAGYTSAPENYGPDKLWNYEIGSKNTLLGGNAQLNAAAFYIDWTQLQNTVALSCGLSFTTNAGRAQSKGFEIDASVRPVRGLTLNGAVSYADAKVKEVAPGVAGRVGDRLPLTAEWSWNASAVYEHDISNNVSAFARAEVNHVGNRWTTFQSITARAINMPSYTTIGARIGVRSDNWSVALVGANLTDERYILNVNPNNYEFVGRPRTLALNMRVGF